MCNWTKWPISLISYASDEIMADKSNIDKIYSDAESTYCKYLYELESDEKNPADWFEFCLTELMTFESAVECFCALKDYYLGQVRNTDKEILERIDLTHCKSSEYVRLKRSLQAASDKGKATYIDSDLEAFNNMIKYSKIMRERHIIKMYRGMINAVTELEKIIV